MILTIFICPFLIRILRIWSLTSIYEGGALNAPARDDSAGQGVRVGRQRGQRVQVKEYGLQGTLWRAVVRASCVLRGNVYTMEAVFHEISWDRRQYRQQVIGQSVTSCPERLIATTHLYVRRHSVTG